MSISEVEKKNLDAFLCPYNLNGEDTHGFENPQYVETLQFCAGAAAREKGFEPGSFAESIALMHSELSEAFEEFRDGNGPTEIYFSQDAQGNQKPEGIPVELADCAIRIMHWFEINGLSLNDVIVKKIRYNRTRPALHGRKF